MRKYGIPLPIVNIIKHDGMKAGVTVGVTTTPEIRDIILYIFAPTFFNSALELWHQRSQPTV